MSEHKSSIREHGPKEDYAPDGGPLPDGACSDAPSDRMTEGMSAASNSDGSESDGSESDEEEATDEERSRVTPEKREKIVQLLGRLDTLLQGKDHDSSLNEMLFDSFHPGWWCDAHTRTNGHSFGYSEEDELVSIDKAGWGRQGSAVATARAVVLRERIARRRELIKSAVAEVEARARAAGGSNATAQDQSSDKTRPLTEAEEMCLAAYRHYEDKVNSLEDQLAQAKEEIAAHAHRLGHQSDYVLRAEAEKEQQWYQDRWALLKTTYEPHGTFHNARKQALEAWATRSGGVGDDSQRVREYMEEFVKLEEEEQDLLLGTSATDPSVMRLIESARQAEIHRLRHAWLEVKSELSLSEWRNELALDTLSLAEKALRRGLTANVSQRRWCLRPNTAEKQAMMQALDKVNSRVRELINPTKACGHLIAEPCGCPRTTVAKVKGDASPAKSTAASSEALPLNQQQMLQRMGQMLHELATHYQECLELRANDAETAEVERLMAELGRGSSTQRNPAWQLKQAQLEQAKIDALQDLPAVCLRIDAIRQKRGVKHATELATVIQAIKAEARVKAAADKKSQLATPKKKEEMEMDAQ